MASTTKEIEKELLSIVRVYKDGSVERLMGSPIVPPSPDPVTGTTVKDVTISQNPKISARLYLPNLSNLPNPSESKLPILIYFHGGAFCIESAFSYLDTRYLKSIVAESKVIAISIEYRLAPEHSLPVAYEDCWTALQWIASHSLPNGPDNEDPSLSNLVDFDKIFVGGDSAGANIAHYIAMRAGNEDLSNGVKIHGVFLSHPYFWGSEPIGAEPDVDHWKSAEGLIWDFVYPSAPGGIDNPLINPFVGGGLEKLGCSRLLVCVAGMDSLRERGVLYCDSLKKSGWKGEVELFEVMGENHAFHIFNIQTENGISMIKRLGSFLSK